MPSNERVDRRIWWFTVSNADRSRRMRTDDLEAAFGSAGLLWLTGMQSWLNALSWSQIGWHPAGCSETVKTWLKATRSSVFAMNGRYCRQYYRDANYSVFNWKYAYINLHDSCK